MDYHYNITTPNDIIDLIKRLRYYDKIEMESCGANNLSPEDIINNHIELYSVFDGNNVIQAMFGCSKTISLLYFTFVGSDEIYKNTKLYTRKAQSYIENRSDRYYDLQPSVIIHPDNKKSKKWIEYMGFTNSGWQVNNLELYQKIRRMPCVGC